METMAGSSTEYRLLEIYHSHRKSRFKRSKLLQARVPASAKTDALDEVAEKLSHIVDSIPPAQDQVVTDNELDVTQRIVELLIVYGDQVNEKIQKDEELVSYLQGFSYNLFSNLASAFIRSMVPLGQQREDNNVQKIKIAWAFEMTSRMSALNLQPMNRIMGFGAQYVNQHFAPWIQQHGGWENAFKTEEGDEVQ